jgi:TolA-binding protein
MKNYLLLLVLLSSLVASSCARITKQFTFSRKPTATVAKKESAPTRSRKTSPPQQPASVSIASAAPQPDHRYEELTATVTELQSQIKQLNGLVDELKKQTQYVLNSTSLERENQALKVNNEHLTQVLTAQNLVISQLSTSRSASAPQPTAAVAIQPANTGANSQPRTGQPTIRANQTARYYIKGPKGICYYINSSGNKTLVDRSLCE